DTIAFNIAPGGVQTITPTSPLPTITDPVTLDATTQPGFAGMPVIELNGSRAGNVDGLVITAGNSTIRGLAINRFVSSGLRLTTNGGDVLEGNFLGTDVTGTMAIGNGTGVTIRAASNNQIGGTAARNLISGNAYGIEIEAILGESALGNVIQ